MSDQAQPSQSRRIPEARIAEYLRAACVYLKERGGVARKSEVIEAIRPRLHLSPEELSHNPSGYERWHAGLAFAFIGFQKAGYLKRGGGTWRLLDDGRAAMDSMTAMEMLEAADEKYKEWAATREDGEPEDESDSAINVGTRESRIWLIGTGSDGAMWDRFRSKGEIAIGFTYDGKQVGDLSKMTTEQIAERIRTLSGKRSPKNDIRACTEFSRTMREGELVIARKGNSQLLGIGRVVGPYLFDAAASDYAHSRKVEWIEIHNRTMPKGVLLSTKTLTEMSRYPDYVALMLGTRTGSAATFLESVGHDAASIDAFFAQRSYAVGAPPLVQEAPQIEPLDELSPTLDSIVSDSFATRAELESIIAALKTKRAVVLQGSPGTGKTYLAQKLAHHYTGSKDRVHRVQFHPAYSYEDFVRGIRPTANGFAVENGPLVRVSEEARRAPNDRFVLLIDEMNRGNVAKILGEALSLIELDKRDPKHKVKLGLALNGDYDFWIPPNVAVLATMNTADRSIALVDFALRRRFKFIPLVPAYDRSAFKDWLFEQFAPGAGESAPASDRSSSIGSTIIDAMNAINALIVSDKSFGKGFAIGHSFFCTYEPRDGFAPERWAKDVFEQEICPLIDEYCVEHPALRKKLLDLVPTF